nr:MAG TPA: hypothetical protein [Caudoviricetes sp.]
MLPITVIVFIVYHSFFLVSAVTRPHTASPCLYETKPCHGYNQPCLTMPLLSHTLPSHLTTPLCPCKAALYIAIPLQHVHDKSLPCNALALLRHTLQCYASASPNFT